MTQSWPNSGIDLLLDLDESAGRQAGLELALRSAIRDGRLAPGTRLPATRRLAGDLGLARGTVRAAYDQLLAEGYLTARQGSGTVVAAFTQLEPVVPPRFAPPTPPLYDLRPGSPDVSAFPVTAWLESARRAVGRAPAEAYGYGDPRGRIELRTALAGYLGRARGVVAAPERIVITNGYLQALALLTRVIGGTIATEDPGVALHRSVIRDNRGTVLPLPVDDRGARTDLLSFAEYSSVDAVEVTPAHQYPAGVTLHPERRRALVDWARSSRKLVIENDYDGEFRYDRKPVGALQAAAPDEVIYFGTASKTLSPALRIGWLVVPQRLLGPIVEAKYHSDHHTEHFGQLTLADFIDRHAYDRHIRASRLRYRRRRDMLLASLEPHRKTFGVEGIAAGLQLLLTLPQDGPSENDIAQAAAAQRLSLGYLSDRWHEPAGHRQGVIVGYGRPPEHAYSAAIDALTSVLRTA